MITTRIIAALLLPPMALLAGCVGDTAAYPSLAPRPIEKITMQTPGGPPVAPPTDAAPTPLPTHIADIVAAAQKADADFKARLAQERPVIDKGRSAAAGSEAWVAAQEAYSVVDTARGGIGSALADLDRLHQQAVAAADAARLADIENAIGQIQALDTADRETLAELLPPS